MDVPKADLYHCVATGYAGCTRKYGKAFPRKLASDLRAWNLYREREEELIKAQWVKGVYKNIWIEQFKKMSLLAYDKADAVTCLFERARTLQMELGCPEEKIQVTPNGIDVDGFADIPGKNPEEQMINIELFFVSARSRM